MKGPNSNQHSCYEIVLSRLTNVKRGDGKATSRCPGHDDRENSLSVAVGDDGRVLLHCFAGCEPADILAKVGLGFNDLYPEKTRPASRANERQSYRSTFYKYPGEDGRLLYEVERRGTAAGKTFLQRKPKPGGGWDYQLGDVRRVPYRLPDLLRDVAAGRTVLYPEGEKDVDRLVGLGYAATTHAAGAGGFTAKVAPTVVAALTGADVLLSPDHDRPGYELMAKIYDAIDGVANSVEVLRIVGLPNGSDISDYLDRYGERAKADLERIISRESTSTVDQDGVGLSVISLAELSQLAAKSVPPQAAPDGASEGLSSFILSFGADETAIERPEFPVDVFPEDVRKYVVEGADAINVPVDMVALPLLAVAGGTIGNTVALAVRSSWIERPNPWLAEVAPPGSGKSPAMDYALAPVRAIQGAAIETYREALDEWQAEVDAAKSNKDNRDPLPEKPHLDHYFTTDATIEGLVSVLQNNPGVTVMRDELGGLVASFDAYRKGADRQSYLSLWAGSSLKVDRKGAGTTWVPRPCVAVIGGIQPDMLSDLGEKDGKRDGFIERFLIAEPTPKPQRWTDADVDPQLRVAMITLFEKLRVKHRAKTEAELAADFEQGVLFMTVEAKEAFASWYDQNAAITEESQGIAAGFYAKYPGQLARIALILHCLHHPGDATTKVGVDSITGSISVIEYFRSHLRGILPHFGGTGSTKSAGLEPRLMRLLDSHLDEWVGRSDIHRALGGNVPADDLATLLDRLADEGTIENRKTQPPRGRPREETRSLARKKELKNKVEPHDGGFDDILLDEEMTR